jgi:hypothetical protein
LFRQTAVAFASIIFCKTKQDIDSYDICAFLCREAKQQRL